MIAEPLPEYSGQIDTEAAELTKLLENTFRMINIGLVNEMAVICDRLGVDVGKWSTQRRPSPSAS